MYCRLSIPYAWNQKCMGFSNIAEFGIYNEISWEWDLILNTECVHASCTQKLWITSYSIFSVAVFYRDLSETVRCGVCHLSYHAGTQIFRFLSILALDFHIKDAQTVLFFLHSIINCMFCYHSHLSQETLWFPPWLLLWPVDYQMCRGWVCVGSNFFLLVIFNFLSDTEL